jgi:hypothetical protein
MLFIEKLRNYILDSNLEYGFHFLNERIFENLFSIYFSYLKTKNAVFLLCFTSQCFC